MQINIARKGQLFLLLSFAALIVIGTALLLLPGILNEGTLTVTDALFMACSAVCLNGLATVPLSEFSFAGQLILLILIQVGTLGIMTLSAMILLLMGKGLSYGDALLISSINERFTLRGAEQLTSTIVHYTLFTEAVGAVLLLPGFVADGHGWYSLWYSLYYAVGSFCNAGLGPLPGSCASLNRYSQIICMFLMVLGVAVCGINQDNSVTCGWGLILMGVISIPVTAFHLWTDRKGWRPLLWYDDPDRKQYIDQETKEKDLATIRFFANFELIFFGLFSVGLPIVGILKLLGMI